MTAEAKPVPTRPRELTIASRLAWVWGSLGAFSGFAGYVLSLYSPAFPWQGNTLATHLFFDFVTGILYGLLGYLLATQKWPGQWLGVGVPGYAFLLKAFTRPLLGWLALGVNFYIVAAVIVHWKKFPRRSSAQRPF